MPTNNKVELSIVRVDNMLKRWLDYLTEEKAKEIFDKSDGEGEIKVPGYGHVSFYVSDTGENVEFVWWSIEFNDKNYDYEAYLYIPKEVKSETKVRDAGSSEVDG